MKNKFILLQNNLIKMQQNGDKIISNIQMAQKGEKIMNNDKLQGLKYKFNIEGKIIISKCRPYYLIARPTFININNKVAK